MLGKIRMQKSTSSVPKYFMSKEKGGRLLFCRIRLSFPLLIFLILLGCGSKGGEKSDYVRGTRKSLALGSNVTIVAFGDSITEGYAVKNNYVNMWKKALKEKYPGAAIKMINAGVSGDTAREGLKRLESDVLRHNPDLVSIGFGWNDLTQRVGKKNFEKTLREIVKKIKGKNPSTEILLLTTSLVNDNLANAYSKRYNEIIRKVAREHNLGLVDIYKSWKKKLESGVLPEKYMADFVHPNEEGHKIFAEELMKFF
jgi:acyl-CoA thioesterase-1